VIQVLIADDHDIVREGVKQIVSDTSDIVVGGEARSGSETIAEIRRAKWDVIILDLNLPDRAGLDVLAQIRSIAPQTPVLIFTMHTQASYATRALKAGAAGYVSKDNARARASRRRDPQGRARRAIPRARSRGERRLRRRRRERREPARTSLRSRVSGALPDRGGETSAADRVGAEPQRAHGGKPSRAAFGKDGTEKQRAARAVRDRARPPAGGEVVFPLQRITPVTQCL
jgi:DNA-binding NarL/FixJ family response regulator